MSTLIRIRPGDNPDLTKERKTGNFDVYKMSAFIYGEEKIVQRRKEIREFVESKEEFRDPIPVEFMDRESRVDNAARKAVAMTKNTHAIDSSDFFGEFMYFQDLIIGRDFHALTINMLMFIPALQGQCDDEQREQWMPLVMNRGIIGTYAQTELGHGSYLSGLETTATYDPTTQEFILQTPSLKAAKWWPGGLAKSANYAVVMANMYTNGKCKGPHGFMCHLRDLETHKVLPGLKIGDIGLKLGMNGSDNGYLIFTEDYRIPRKHMLMRNGKVEPDGTYVPPKHAKLGYATMVFVRSIIVKDEAQHLGAASTIGIRYSAIRRQGELETGKGEVQILDYQTQQLRLFPQLAKAFAFLFAAYEIRNLYLKVTEELSKGNVDLLPELHALSAGLKAVGSWEASKGIEQLRLACGGHGYSQASGYPEMYAFAVAACTTEGDNIILLLQVARFLMKAAKEVRTGKAHLAEICAYLGYQGQPHCMFTSWTSYSDADIIHDFENVARRQIFKVYDTLINGQNGATREESWNKLTVELYKASRAHVKLYLIKNFLRKVATAEDETIKAPLTDLTRLYAFEMIGHSEGEFMKGGFMSENQVNGVRTGLYECLKRIRPNAVSLVDSWDFCDRELHSVLGRRDGNVYPALLEWAQESQLNKSDVLPTFEKYLGPMMKEGRELAKL